MRRNSLFAFLVVSALVACKSPDRGQQPPPGPGQVRMTLTCAPDGNLGDFSLVPWSVRLPNENAAFTFINDPSSNADFEIAAVNQKFPFGGQKFSAKPGRDVVAKPIKDTEAGKYKYSVTVICPKAGGGADTTVVDPDMIIPWKISTS